MNFLRNLSYNPTLRSMARALRLNNLFREYYFKFAKPKDGILSLNVGNHTADFKIHDAGELRILESVGGGKGELEIFNSLLDFLQEGDTVYDIGGHVGLYAVFLAKAVGSSGKVYTFEPDPSNLAHLKSNLELNQLSSVTIFNKALGDEPGQGQLHVGPASGNRSLLFDYKNGESVSVDIIQGDEFAEAQGLPIPKLVKIDVEGFEFNVIKGLKSILSHSDCKVLSCEIHPTMLPDNVSKDDVVNIIKECGFQGVKLVAGEEVFYSISTKP